MTKKKKGISAGNITAVGAGVAAVGAGAYYLLGPKGKQHREKTKTWMVEIEKEIEKKLKKAKNITELFYHGAVDNVVETYGKQYKEYAGEINSFAKKIKDKWKNIQPKNRPVIKKTKNTAKKVV